MREIARETIDELAGIAHDLEARTDMSSKAAFSFTFGAYLAASQEGVEGARRMLRVRLCADEAIEWCNAVASDEFQRKANSIRRFVERLNAARYN